MEFPTILGLIVVFIIWFAYQRKKNSRTKESEKKMFWDTESQANSIRRKSLDSLEYISLNPGVFPTTEIDDTTINSCIKTIERLSSEKIADFTGLTNTELKMKYGSPNLNLLTEYENNYILLLRTLNRWGKRLTELGHDSDAIIVLEYAININSDISETYSILKNLYIKTGRPERINFLLESAQNLNSINRKVIIEILNASI